MLLGLIQTIFILASGNSPMSDQGLERTGKFCGGLIADIKRRKPYYVDDYLQGCNPKVMASTIFTMRAAAVITVKSSRIDE